MNTFPAPLILAIHVLVGAILIAPGFYSILTRQPVAPLVRNTQLILALLSLATGLLNFFTRIGEGVAKGYHMWFGVKFLLALHVISIAVIAAGANQTPEKRTSLLKGAAWSGAAVIILGVFLKTFAK